MNIFDELEDLENMQLKLKNTADNILDVYKKNPKECGKLLRKLNDIDEELNDLEKEYQLILEQI